MRAASLTDECVLWWLFRTSFTVPEGRKEGRKELSALLLQTPRQGSPRSLGFSDGLGQGKATDFSSFISCTKGEPEPSAVCSYYYHTHRLWDWGTANEWAANQIWPPLKHLKLLTEFLIAYRDCVFLFFVFAGWGYVPTPLPHPHSPPVHHQWWWMEICRRTHLLLRQTESFVFSPLWTPRDKEHQRDFWTVRKSDKGASFTCPAGPFAKTGEGVAGAAQPGEGGGEPVAAGPRLASLCRQGRERGTIAAQPRMP